MEGIGNRAGGILNMLGLNIGNKEEEEMQNVAAPATAPAPVQQENTGNGMGMGLGNMMSGISNSMFKGMSQEQVYKMGMAFNTLRLEPDNQLAANFESRIKTAAADKKLTSQTNQTVDFLSQMKTDAYPAGRSDLISLVQAGLITPLDAIAEARTPAKTTELEDRLNFLRNPNNNLSEEEQVLLFPASDKESWQKKQKWLIDNPDASDGAMQILGINQPAEYKQQMEDLKQQLEDRLITQSQFEEGSFKLLTGIAPAGEAPRLTYLKQLATDVNGFEENSEEYINFINANIDGAAVQIDMNEGGGAANLYLKNYIDTIYTEESNDIVKAVDQGKIQIEKLSDLLNILESDETNSVAPFTGFFQPALTQMAAIVTQLGIDKKYASEIDAYKNSTGEAKAKARDILYEKLVKTEITKVMTGSDVFPMISTLGIGARGLDTPAERDFLISVMTGLPNMTIDTLKYMTKYRLQLYLDGMEAYNAKVKSGYFKLHNQNPVLVPRKEIDIEPYRRYNAAGEKINRNAEPKYSQDEYNLIFGNMN